MKYICRMLILSISVFFFGSCAVKQEAANDDLKPMKGPLTLPGTFVGEIPCEDCWRVELTLNLRPDSIYQLRKDYISAKGSTKVESQLGYWRLAEEGGFIIFGKRKGALKSYEIIDDDLLRFVGLQGVGTKEQIQYDLTRKGELDPFEDSVKLRGMMTHSSGSSTFSECKSGQSFPLTGGVEYRRLVQSYLNSEVGRSEPVLVSIQGGLQTEPFAGGQDTVVVEHFKKLYRTFDCEGKRIRANLISTLWRLVEIDGKPVTLEGDAKSPYFVLNAGKKDIMGAGSCNSLGGTFLAKGEVFLVKRNKTTRIACLSGIELETSFFSALDAAEKYRIAGEELQLFDEDGVQRAVFKADH